MINKRIRFGHKSKAFKPRSLSLIFLLLLLTIFLNITITSNETNKIKDNSTIDQDKNPKLSWWWATLDLTNPSEVNDTKIPFTHNTEIYVKGRLYNRITGDNKSGNNVAIVVNGLQDSRYTDTTDLEGKFQINYTIDPSLNIYIKHRIEVLVITGIPTTPSGAEVEYRHHYIIETNATSYFDINNWSPGIPGEDFTVPGVLRFDNQSGIPNQQIFSSWLNKSINIKNNNPFNTNPDGSFPVPLTIPNDNHSDVLSLNFTYLGNGVYINGSNTEIVVKLFRNITCIWNTVSSATEGAQIIIRGQILDRNNTNIAINNRLVDIYYDNQPEGTATTDQNGNFQFSFSIPSGLGIRPIDVIIVNSLGLTIQSNITHYISITGAIASETSSPSGKDQPEDPPFYNFFLVLIPIVIGGVVAFVIYAYFFLKKQEEESMLVKLPLEGRIRNLKILKDTGRLEEALSYLFQSIYLELINAKYGRVKKTTETIRDFAIISVKELNLKPSNIYPFIQNVEKIIYDKPFIINEKDFYTAVALFSPIYFELTGYNFVLNF